MEEPEINLTPLIDVVFVILIMFILIAPLLEVDKIELAGAPSGADESVSVQDTSPITVQVYQDNSLKFNNQEVNIEQLGLLLKQAKEKHPGVKPQVLHDRRAHFGTYQGVKNAAELAGFEEMDIVLKPG